MWHFWGVVSWLWVCVEVAVDRISQIRALSTPSPPTCRVFFRPYPEFSVFDPGNSYLKSGRALSWFWCRLAVYISLSVTSRKVCPRAKLIRFAKSASSNIVLYSRSGQRQKGSILFACLGWPLSLWRWKQDSSSQFYLAIAGKLWPGRDESKRNAKRCLSAKKLFPSYLMIFRLL